MLLKTTWRGNTAQERTKERTYHILICLSKESFGKDGDNKDIDDEGDKEGNTGFNEEIFVGLTDLLLIGPIYLTRLERKRNECHSLQKAYVKNDQGKT